MAPTMQSTADDRRLHPRRAVRHPLSLGTASGVVIPCESVDVSLGGMKIRSTSRIPLGPADVVIAAEDDDWLAVRGEVVEAVLDASTGETTARIVFDPALPAAIERVVALPDRGIEVPRSRRRTFTALAASIVAGIVVAGGVYAATRDDDAGVRHTEPASTTAPARRGLAEPSPIDAPPHVAVSSAPTSEATAPAATVAPATRPAQAPADRPPAEAPAPRVERTNDLTRVVLGETAEETSVRTTTRPSPDGDEVRMQLTITPEPDGTTLPVAVRIENRRTETLTFPDGLRATVTATRDGANDAVSTLRSDVTSLAPGESVTVDGFLDFSATGEYEVSATTTVG